MIDRSITESQIAFSQELAQQLDWILNNEYLQAQLYQNLIKEVHDIMLSEIDSDLEDRLVERIQQFASKISFKMRQIAQNCTSELEQLRLRTKQLEMGLEQKREAMESLVETIQNLKGKISDWQSEYQNAKAQNAEMQQKYERKLREVKREKKQIKQTFRMVQESSELERALMQNLQIEKESISEQIINQQKEKQMLKNELEQVKKKVVDTEKQLQASATKLTWEQKRIKQLQEEATSRQQTIRQLMQEIQQLQQLPPKANQSDKYSQPKYLTKSFAQQLLPPNEEKKYVSFIETFKLSDQIFHNNEEYEVNSRKSLRKSYADNEQPYIENMDINKSFNQEARSVHSQRSKQANSLGKPSQPYPSQVNIPDFYLAHFLLTSQAMKIKLGREEYLAIDLSIYYPDLVRERIPFHTWDEWIRDKLHYLHMQRIQSK